MRGREKRRPFQHTIIPPAILFIILLFGRKKTQPGPVENRPPDTLQTDPANSSAFPAPETLKKTVTEGDMSRARDKLRVASLERDIIGDALTKIYEAEARGQINEPEKNQLIQRYKVDLKRVDGEIDVQKRIVDLHELESAKEDLLKSFYEKLMEIDLRIGQLRPGLDMLANSLGQETKPVRTVPSTPAVKENQTSTTPTQPQQEKPARERPKSKAEERLEAIKDEVLKAMERLEQIETEP